MKSHIERSFIFIASAFFLRIVNNKYCGNAISCELEYHMYCARTIISRGLYIFTPFFSGVYNQERLILQTIYLLKSFHFKKPVVRISFLPNSSRFA